MLGKLKVYVCEVLGQQSEVLKTVLVANAGQAISPKYIIRTLINGNFRRISIQWV